jgi:hypothetical protein
LHLTIASGDFDGYILGLSATDIFVSQEGDFMEGDTETGDHFGAALAAMPQPVYHIFLPLTVR